MSRWPLHVLVELDGYEDRRWLQTPWSFELNFLNTNYGEGAWKLIAVEMSDGHIYGFNRTHPDSLADYSIPLQDREAAEQWNSVLPERFQAYDFSRSWVNHQPYMSCWLLFADGRESLIVFPFHEIERIDVENLCAMSSAWHRQVYPNEADVELLKNQLFALTEQEEEEADV